MRFVGERRRTVEIQVLHFAGCPNHDRALQLLREVAQELGLAIEVEVSEVPDQAAAAALRFLGSPTIRIAGRDIDPDARERTHFALACRRYGHSGVPPREMIRRALIAGSTT